MRETSLTTCTKPGTAWGSKTSGRQAVPSMASESQSSARRAPPMAMEARCATLAIRSERTSSIRKTPEMPVAHKPIVAELLKEASVGLVHPMASYLQAPGDPPRTTISAGRREHTSTIEMPVDTILLHTRSSKNEILIPFHHALLFLFFAKRIL